MVRAIVTSSGGSYVLKVPKRYVEDNHLKVGDVVTIEEPLILQHNALSALVAYGKERGQVRSMPDPVLWQRRQRQTIDARRQVSSGTA
jgi:hypothetical protein